MDKEKLLDWIDKNSWIHYGNFQFSDVDVVTVYDLQRAILDGEFDDTEQFTTHRTEETYQTQKGNKA